MRAGTHTCTCTPRHVHTYTRVHIHMYTHARTNTHIHIQHAYMQHTNLQPYSHTRKHTHTNIPSYKHKHTEPIHTHMHVPMHARTFIHAHICAHAHTQTTKNATGLQIVKGRVRAALYSARVGSRSAFLGQGPSGGFAGGRLRRGPWEPVAVAVAEGTGRGPRAAARGAHGREKRFSRHRLDGYFFRR